MGKTSTAGLYHWPTVYMIVLTTNLEGIAEFFEKPLFQITCGRIIQFNVLAKVGTDHHT